MSRILAFSVLILGLAVSAPVGASERTVTLAVKNVYCAACPATVRKSLEAVTGVIKAVVSYKEQTAVVTYDDAKTDVPSLTAATTNAGYPSSPKS